MRPPHALLSTAARLGALALSTLALSALALGACGGTTTEVVVVPGQGTAVKSRTPNAPAKLGFPALATKNTTRVAGSDPIADAAGVALAVFPSQATGTHPSVVTLAPTDDWQAAIAASVLMAPPIKAPILLSGSSALPKATSDALTQLAPTGSGVVAGAQVIRIGDVPNVGGARTQAISGGDPYTLAAAIDRFASAAHGTASSDVVIASGDNPAYAMPAAGWAAESGDSVLFVKSSSVPSATAQALLAHQHPHIYVLGPASVISNSVVAQLRKYGTVKRVGGPDPAANSVAFAVYRDPPCPYGQPCAHVPGSFGWAMRSPGHGYVLLNAAQTLDAAAAAPLSGSGDYGPQLLIQNPAMLPSPVLNYFLNYATPGYTQEGPTAAVYNHAWVIGDTSAITVSVQAELDNLLEVVPQK
ncbi:MAG TPA: cell wall-binding repeat-containing protein [Solirubrobacteraceae bacterium]|nr:cell wall-binding repeat-containing protein [Solirubrobacteraceae bacterium]